jgi:hypothetical protein
MRLTQPSLSSPAAPVVSALALNASTELGLIRSGLLAEYRFNEGTGQVLYDYSSQGNHGTLGSGTGSDIYDPTWTGQGTYFTTNDYIQCPGVSVSSGLTVMFVCKPSSCPVNTTLISQWSGTTMVWKIRTHDSDAKDLTMNFSDNGSWDVGHRMTKHATGDPFADGTWVCLTLTFNAGTVTLYKTLTSETLTDGGVGSITSLSSSATSPIYIGRDGSGGYSTQTMAYALIYNRALSKVEITQNYNYLKKYLLVGRGISI